MGKKIIQEDILKVVITVNKITENSERKKRAERAKVFSQNKYSRALLFFLYFVINPGQNVRDQSIEINVKRFVAVSLKRDTQFRLENVQ